ncbi:MAG: T9SS type A sorting domain-containing protein, partial [Bacteroidetes bacterium]|nr:T9SS type A sorting domain-containing protein [Bacteroidota bacterium]
IWATGGGKLFKTINGGTSWVTVTGIPAGTISYIACHNTDSKKAYITYSGFSNKNKVLQTNDQGVNWINLSSSLPNIPINCITFVNGSSDGLYIGTDVGAFYKDASMGYWQSFSKGLPNVAVTQINIFYPTNKIRCSTYGRGMWESDSFVPAIYPPVANFTSKGSISCPGAGVQFTDASAGQPTSWKWTFQGGNPSSSTVQNPYIAYNTPGTYAVTLAVTNSVGTDTLTYNSHVVISTSTVAAPTTTDDSRCSPGVVNLKAAGAGTGTLRWWDSPGGGTMVTTGTTYSPNLTTTTTYYVDQAFPQAPDVTMTTADVNGPGASFTANDVRGLYFDVLAPIILNSVVVLAGSDGDRTIEILDPSGGTVMDTTVFIPTGLNVVTVNFKIYPGNQYFIKCRGMVDLYRNNAGAVFPYTSPYVNITETNASLPGYYYFFYDWQYTPLPCNTARTPVTGNIGCVDIIDGLANGSLNIFPNPNEGTFDLSFIANNMDDYTINIYNTLGQSIYKESLKNFSGNYSQKIDITSFGPGVYMMNLSNSKNQMIKKVITY